MPSVDRARSLANCLYRHTGGAIHGCFGFVDGTVVRMENSGDSARQNAYYNGMDCMEAVKCVFISLVDGTTGWAVVNDYGSCHDTRCMSWTGIIDTLDSLYPAGLCIVGYVGIPAGRHILRPMTKSEISQLSMTVEDLDHYTRCNKAISSVREAAEWCNRSLKEFAVYQRPLPADDEVFRRLVFDCTVRLVNVRARLMARGEIRSTFGWDEDQCSNE